MAQALIYNASAQPVRTIRLHTLPKSVEQEDELFEEITAYLNDEEFAFTAIVLDDSKAFEILAQPATAQQRRSWVEGNAVEREFDGFRYSFLYADGSMIVGHGCRMSAYA